MLRGDYKGKFLGSGSDTWKYWAELRAGNITPNDWQDIEDGIARSAGHCMTDGYSVDHDISGRNAGIYLRGCRVDSSS
jgi:dihydroxy-acid dehydratase